MRDGPERAMAAKLKSLLGATVALFAELRRGLRRKPVPPTHRRRYQRTYSADIAAIVVDVVMEWRTKEDARHVASEPDP